MMALETLRTCGAKGGHHVLDADIRDYFGSIEHGKLMKLVERRVSDRRVLKLVRKWLEAGVMEDGVVSANLAGAASEMIIPLLPAFVTGVLGGGVWAIGWIEGLADGTASLLKLASGRLADRMGRYRPLVLAGYGLAAVARPLVALATAVWHVVVVRVADRIGKGLRTSPRDALIAASVVPAQRGAAFGLHRTMDHIGAVLGPLCAVVLISVVEVDLRTLFWLAAIPGLLAIAVLWVGVAERAAAPPAPGPRSQGRGGAATASTSTDESAPIESGRLVGVLVPLAIFTLGNASDVFLLVKAGEARAPLVTLPLLWMALHVVKAATSIPGGKIGDRWGHRRTIAVGWLVYAVVYAGFAFADDPWLVAGLFVAYGTYHGLTEGAERALIANLARREGRGLAFGWYHATSGLLSMVASISFGALWHWWGSEVAFLCGTALAALAAALLLWLGRSESR